MTLQPMRDWPASVLEVLRQEASVVRVLVASLRGSAPREAGACMLVSRAGIRGSIGGGRLEWQAINAAHDMLPPAAISARVQRFVLGIELGQCCGGVVELWLERYTAADRALLEAADAAMRSGRAMLLVSQLTSGESPRRELRTPAPIAAAGSADAEHRARTPCATRQPDQKPGAKGASVRLVRSDNGITLFERLAATHAPLWIFGAGHVGQALVRVLADLPLRITWVDSRAELFGTAFVDLDDPVTRLAPASPVDTLASAPGGTCYVVMTHDHALDYALCRAILARGDSRYAGLIGSDSKAARFRSRLAREDSFTPQDIARLTCPIGVDGIASKWPAAIAVAIAAQLLQTLDSPQRDALPYDPTDCSATECKTCRKSR